MGKKNLLEPQARGLYADGHTHEEIQGILDLSVTSQLRWKAETVDPKTGVNAWDLARRRSRSTLDRMRALLEKELTHAEGVQAGAQNPASVDAMIKFNAIIKTLEAQQDKQAERQRLLAAEKNKEVEFDRAKFFLEVMDWLMKYLAEHNPAALSIIVDDVGRIAEAYKSEVG